VKRDLREPVHFLIEARCEFGPRGFRHQLGNDLHLKALLEAVLQILIAVVFDHRGFALQGAAATQEQPQLFGVSAIANQPSQDDFRSAIFCHNKSRALSGRFIKYLSSQLVDQIQSAKGVNYFFGDFGGAAPGRQPFDAAFPERMPSFGANVRYQKGTGDLAG
jgi:hypothetical protein